MPATAAGINYEYIRGEKLELKFALFLCPLPSQNTQTTIPWQQGTKILTNQLTITNQTKIQC